MTFDGKMIEKKTILSHHSVFLTSLRICKLSTKVSFSSIFRDSKLRIEDYMVTDFNAKLISWGHKSQCQNSQHN